MKFFMGHALLFITFFLMATATSNADQYQSNELLHSKGMSSDSVKSIAELEAQLNGLTDAYAKDSTARYLARFYAQQDSKEGLQKAIKYYQASIKGEGLSVYAKQAAALELASLLYVNEKYQMFLNALVDYQSFGGKAKPGLRIQQMLAHYYLENKKTSITLARTIFDEHTRQSLSLNLSNLKQLLFIFYNSNDLLSSIKVQTALIEMDNYNHEHWLRLSQLYLKNKMSNKAADTLLMVVQKGLVHDQTDLLLLCDLLVESGNPFVAARLLQQFMDQFHVDHTLENHDKLFRYWYLAQEIKPAILTLKQSLLLNQDIGRYLDLAELYYQQQDWPQMHATVINGCERPLQNIQVSRANLLLGISELKLGNVQLAKQAFLNASLIGGKVKQAQAYLKYLKVKGPNPAKRLKITGPCEP